MAPAALGVRHRMRRRLRQPGWRQPCGKSYAAGRAICSDSSQRCDEFVLSLATDAAAIWSALCHLALCIPPRQVLVAVCLINGALWLFRNARHIQFTAVAHRRLPACLIRDERCFYHDLIACWWLAMKHSSIRTAVPNRCAVCARHISTGWWSSGYKLCELV